jgi:hypothetical protein
LTDHRRAVKGTVTVIPRYLRTHGDMVPSGVEIWEFDAETSSAQRLC